MPKDFAMCVKNGGKVRTKQMGDGKFAHVCIMDGKSTMGEIKEKKNASGFIKRRYRHCSLPVLRAIFPDTSHVL